MRNFKTDVTTIYWDTAAREAAAASELRPCTQFHPSRARKGPLCACLHPHPVDPRTTVCSDRGIHSQGQNHRTHWLRLSAQDPALLLTLPPEKRPSATKYSFISVTFLFKILGENLKRFFRQPLKDCHVSFYLQETKLYWGQLCLEGFTLPSLSPLIEMVPFVIL